MSQADPSVDRRTVLAAGAGLTAAAIAPGAATAQSDDLESWLSNARNYDGIVDETGSDAVTVDVGAGSNGLAFGPAAVRVSPGTTVTWEWTGEGGRHNVEEVEGSFSSGDPVGEAGTTFEQTFEEAGEFRYVCVPHETVGMKGAIVVDGSGGGNGGGAAGGDGGGSGGDGSSGGPVSGGGGESMASSTFVAVAGVLLVPVAFAVGLLGKELLGGDEDEQRVRPQP